ncbi:hypothetical protein [Streptomyces sp. NPDC088847]|uniref:hypothetical protein n=1 Tax=Streptomyces sp. NPDC088847 TaxID=3365909 RepID=UPI003810592E
MINELRQGLEQAGTWPKYREELKAFRELYGPPLDKMQSFAHDELGIRDSPAKSTFQRLTEAVDKAPDWKHVHLFVRICVRHAENEKDGMQGAGAHLDEVLALWKGAFVRLGGKLPVNPASPAPVQAAAAVAPAVVSFSGPPPSRPAPPWTASWRWIRERPKKVTIPAAVALAALVLGAGAYALIDTGQDSKGTVKTEGVLPGSTPSKAAPSKSSVAQPFIDSVIEWSNDEHPDATPEDPNTHVRVYDNYKEGTGTNTHTYVWKESIRVKCQVTGGRLKNLGDYYSGPKPHRDRIWYRMDTGEWAPAVYVDTGKSSLPTCSTADS